MGFGGAAPDAGFDITTSIAPATIGVPATGRNCPYPSGSQVGDLIVAIFGCSNTSTPSIGAGWTVAASQPTGQLRTIVAWQLYPATLPTTQLITVPANSEGLGCVMLRVPQSSFDAIGTISIDISGTLTLSATGPTAAGGMAIALYRNSAPASRWTAPSGMDILLESETTNAFNFALFTQLVSSGAVGSRTASMSLAGAQRNAGVFTIKK